MSYTDEFNKHIQNKNYSLFLELWEEYCVNDQVNAEELIQILEEVKNSIFSEGFGKHVESIVPLWEAIEDKELAYYVLRLIFDIQTSNVPELANIACEELKERYGDHKHYNEKLRLVGLRNKQNFSCAISNFELLNHMEKGKFVFHTGGWGTGEIMEISLIREQLILEFDLVPGKKDLSFQNAFNNLIALENGHFLSRRFGTPDLLEKEAKENPLKVLKEMLGDLGKKTAAEIKDEFCFLVIPEEDWGKWWQNARAKLKKDPLVVTPKNIKEPFVLRDQALSHEDRVKQQLAQVKSTEETVSVIYSFLKNYPELLKKEEEKTFLLEKINELLESDLTDSLKLQLLFLKEDLLAKKFEQKAEILNLIKLLSSSNLTDFLEEIGIAALKKRVLLNIRESHEEWVGLFVDNVFKFSVSILADYAYKELSEQDQAKTLLEEKKQDLVENPTLYGDAFIWFFQKFICKNKEVLEAPGEKERFFLESFFVLLHYLETQDNRYAIKKMVQMVQKDRFLLIRSLIKGTSVEYLKELLLLASKCRSFGIHDLTILQSLAKVANPDLEDKTKEDDLENIIWTTKEGYEKIKSRIENIATVETVKNAEEIKEARSHGDLKENSEYKYALEKRSRLQEELKRLSKQITQARILAPEDISSDEVGVGMLVSVSSDENGLVNYTLLGPWEAEPDDNILSYLSRFAQAMKGLKKGDVFAYQGKDYTIQSFEPILFQSQ
ncbi:Transcription elongation factor GreA [Chlamydiales bacterium SCGC AB-751-O23]|jgi:transcription elongation factor GreA-like protein/transcription elongation GreA/GreB family factor|nr:Transcription elongation factor GreA [Chlamydiales bacterium SCGC AB-751-O23]